MKRNYAALLLGLALSVSSMSVFASESTTEAVSEVTSEAAADETEQAAEENLAAAKTVVGQVTAVSSDSITISKGTLSLDVSEEAASDTNTEDTAEADTEEDSAAAEDETSAQEESNADSAAADTAAMTLTLSGESSTYDLTDDVTFGELAKTDVITVVASEDDAAAAEDSTEAISEAADADEEETSENTASDTGEDEASAADDAEIIEISADGIMEGDIVSIQLNEDGSVSSVTILSYGTGSTVDTGSDTISEELVLTEESTESAAE